GCPVYNNFKPLQTTLVLVNEYDKRNIFMTTAIITDDIFFIVFDLVWHYGPVWIKFYRHYEPPFPKYKKVNMVRLTKKIQVFHHNVSENVK
ncbi:MAG: hypothetical protein PVI96_18010, partial [Desulfobacterales bacterium]